MHKLLLSLLLLSSASALASPVDDLEQFLQNSGMQAYVLPKPSDRPVAIKQLKLLQITAKAPQAQEIAFLLAAMGSNYEHNRDYLVWVLQGCYVKGVTRGCDDMTGDYLLWLWKHGHPEVLAMVMRDSYKNWSAAGGEGIGATLSLTATYSPEIFLTSLRSFIPIEQRKICYSIGSGDGGGMNIELVKQKWKPFKDHDAQQCLQEFERANLSLK